TGSGSGSGKPAPGTGSGSGSGKPAPGTGSGSGSAKPPPPSIPEQVTEAAFAAEMSRLEPKMRKCGLRNRRLGHSIRATIQISPDGTISDLQIQATAPLMVGCARQTLQAARFPVTQRGGQFTRVFE
ncbi:MAG TPA: hypothetical protein VNO30_10570, partial [Kofleriaceae bacterium]|nr:hypothetical protein [Kofleriaceae bacterium]